MSVLKTLSAKAPPWQFDPDGICRVGGTRVRLETVLTTYNQGAAAEEILLKFPSLRLEDIYAVITYYLWRPDEVNSYLDQRAGEEAAARDKLEKQFPSQGVRERLLARKKT
ncbi:MAG: DUF433 domain-containing protein [Gemmataceae bacterium]|nr:DUF433 domain-containing protein [Gemmataceae bacterium]MCI0743138.1 DUF433 domain-containing protein [Gemmataceae bacterium]